MQRLNQNLLSPLSVYATPKVSITISLLNVRSLIPTLPGIECDVSLSCASILCFTETWLIPEKETPVISGNYQAIRNDHVSGKSKGGVLTSLPEDIQLCDIQELSLNGVFIEAVSTTLFLPTGNSIHLTVVYGSPTVAFDMLLNVLSGLLTDLECYDMFLLLVVILMKTY